MLNSLLAEVVYVSNAGQSFSEAPLPGLDLMLGILVGFGGGGGVAATDSATANLPSMGLQGQLSIRPRKVQIFLPLPTPCAQEVSQIRNFY